jgi:hypothetical protein
MKPVEKNNSFLKYMIIVMILAGLMMWSTALIAAQSDESQAPGRTMAQQATKGKKVWNTTDHTKHKALQKDFKSGLEVTQACLSGSHPGMPFLSLRGGDPVSQNHSLDLAGRSGRQR